ncbi:MAG: carbohydrate ABC transporter permease [Clostridiales bacterium]|jgi:raffinose/stachyose/melibiose transport system permease protein|nr:carbohydrate ABC transporter permease [Clostridiales bacterium]
MTKKPVRIAAEIASVLVVLIIFGIPFYYVLINSFKDRAGAAQMSLGFPEAYAALENYRTSVETSNYMIIRGFGNSAVITASAIAILVVLCSMGGFVLQRRSGKLTTFANFLFLVGLMIPPAIVPTIWVLDWLGIYRSLFAMVLVEAAINIPFTLMLYRAFMASIPRELDEAAKIDGCGQLRLFGQIVFPLLKPVTASVVVLNAVNVFNDFVNPLYFLPGARNVTVQLTMYNFIGRYASSWNLLFANVALISVPPLILFIFFSKRIVSGMVAGSVKG